MRSRRRPVVLPLALVVMLLVAGCSGVRPSGKLVSKQIDADGGFDRIQSSSGSRST